MTSSLRPVSGAFVAVAIALTALTSAAPAFADENRDRAAAIQACKIVVADELHIQATDVRLEKLKTRPRTIEVTVEARREGARLALADCTWNRAGGKVDVVMTPPLGRPAGA